MRTIEDYAMGINFSRVMSVKYGNLLNSAANTSSYTAIAVGRVMTCVLGMVVIREREIRNFKETPFYRVIGKFTESEIEGEWKTQEQSKYFESPLLYKENGFKKEEDAKGLIDSLNGKTARIKHRFFLTLPNFRRNAPNALRSVRIRRFRSHRICMRKSLRLIQEQMRVFYPLLLQKKSIKISAG